MGVVWSSDPGAFASSEWAGLVRADPDGTVFHSPRYLRLYWEELATGHLWMGFVERGGETVGAAAFEVRDGRLAFLGGTEVTDYMGPVGIPEARDASAKELVGALAARRGWDRAELGGLPEDGGWLGALARAAADAGLAARVGDDGVAPFLELPGSFDAYLASLHPRRRHELRRKLRRLNEALPEARVVDATPESFPGDLDHFADLHRSSPGPKGRFMDPGMERFFRRLGEELLPDGSFRLAFLESEGRRPAGVVGFRDRGRLLLYNSAYDHATGQLSPGVVLVVELIRQAIEEGRHAVDFLTGDLAYKYRFGARPRRIAALHLER